MGRKENFIKYRSKIRRHIFTRTWKVLVWSQHNSLFTAIFTLRMQHSVISLLQERGLIYMSLYHCVIPHHNGLTRSNIVLKCCFVWDVLSTSLLQTCLLCHYLSFCFQWFLSLNCFTLTHYGVENHPVKRSGGKKFSPAFFQPLSFC